MRLDNLHVAWDTDLILHGISLTIPAGQTVALTGSNGSGKSTTIKALLGTAPITGGDAQALRALDHRASPRAVEQGRLRSPAYFLGRRD